MLPPGTGVGIHCPTTGWRHSINTDAQWADPWDARTLLHTLRYRAIPPGKIQPQSHIHAGHLVQQNSIEFNRGRTGPYMCGHWLTSCQARLKVPPATQLTLLLFPTAPSYLAALPSPPPLWAWPQRSPGSSSPLEGALVFFCY